MATKDNENETDRSQTSFSDAGERVSDGSSDGSSESTPGQRRDALRKILAGGGIVIGAESLPSNWSRPVIDSVVLPAHAATSLTDPCSLDISDITGGFQVIVNGFISPPTGGVTVQIRVELLSGNTVVDSDTTNATSDSNGEYSSPPVSLTGSGTSIRATTSLNGGEQAVCQQPLSTSTTTTTFSTTTSTFTSTTTSFPTFGP